MEQRTDEWFAARLGSLTASRLNDAFDLTAKGLEGAKRQQYRLELVAERLTGLQTEFFENNAMKWGSASEPYARSAYEADRGVMVQEVGFIKHPTLEWAGASPDGLVNDGLIEIKCPTTTTHIKTLLSGVVPEQYKNQMLWQMLCTGRKWCDFVSFDSRLPDELQLFIKRYEPTAEELQECQQKAIEFLDSVQKIVDQLEKIGCSA
jgi:putative phage-type endonuclease